MPQTGTFGQREQRLLVTAQLAGTFPGAGLAAARGQKPGNEPDDTRGDHVEPLPVDLFCRGLRVFPAIFARICPRACLAGRLRSVCPTRSWRQNLFE
jgi:hypothetical protein